MPRFFFHLHDGLDTLDREGRELPNVFSAEAEGRAEAIRMAAVSVCEQKSIEGQHRIDVADESGTVIYSVSFREVIAIKT